MQHVIYFWGIIVFQCLLMSCNATIENNNREPIPVLFDTDIGNDIDDVLTFQMLHHYENQGLISILGVTVSKSNPLAVSYADGYNRFNGKNNIPVGYVFDGPNKDDGKYLKQTLDTIIDGKKILMPKVQISEGLPAAYLLQRKLLAAQKDSSVVMIAVGPQTNICRLLESEPDEFSKLNGVDLVARKVKLLVLMGGNFDIPDKRFPEWNIIQDITSSQVVFRKWPTRIVASGFEIGQNLLFPHQHLLNDLPDAEKHPMVVSYKLFDNMPYDRQTWDLTAVLYAIEHDAGLFEISSPGTISVDEKGNTVFEASESGKHCFLLLNKEKHEQIINALVKSVTGKN
ncbi:MAG: nucleoside hydrolase [Paludibacter sp. 47-17]|nr:MAG: nucleoside hydrolase [Paludibacter sp. 47-17]